MGWPYSDTKMWEIILQENLVITICYERYFDFEIKTNRGDKIVMKKIGKDFIKCLEQLTAQQWYELLQIKRGQDFHIQSFIKFKQLSNENQNELRRYTQQFMRMNKKQHQKQINQMIYNREREHNAYCGVIKNEKQEQNEWEYMLQNNIYIEKIDNFLKFKQLSKEEQDELKQHNNYLDKLDQFNQFKKQGKLYQTYVYSKSKLCLNYKVNNKDLLKWGRQYVHEKKERVRKLYQWITNINLEFGLQ